MDEIDPSKSQLSELFSAFTLWTAAEIVTILVLSGVLILAIQRILPAIARYTPARWRLILLGAVPILRLAILTIAFLWLVPVIFNVTLKNIVLIFGALSVAVGFALKDIASATIAGIVTVIERPYRVGDWVRVDAHYGEVISIGTRAFSLRTADDDIVTQPHTRIWEKAIANANDGTETLMCVAEFHIDPRDDTTGVRALLGRVARTSAYLSYEHPVLVVEENRPYAIRYKLRAYPFEMRDQFAFISDLSRRGRDALRAAGLRLVQMPALEAGDGPPARTGGRAHNTPDSG